MPVRQTAATEGAHWPPAAVVLEPLPMGGSPRNAARNPTHGRIPVMSKPNASRRGQTEFYEGPGPRDQFARAERQAREVVEWADAGESSARAARDRRDDFGRYRERAAALQDLSDAFHNGTGRERRRAVAASPAYRALPEAAQREWIALLSASDRLEVGRHGGIVQPARELARTQAETLTTWDPVAPEIEVDIDLIPRS